jgi:hypothetical protein
MSEKRTSPPALDPELAKNIATVKRGVEAKVAERSNATSRNGSMKRATTLRNTLRCR